MLVLTVGCVPKISYVHFSSGTNLYVTFSNNYIRFQHGKDNLTESFVKCISKVASQNWTNYENYHNSMKVILRIWGRLSRLYGKCHASWSSWTFVKTKLCLCDTLCFLWTNKPILRLFLAYLIHRTLWRHCHYIRFTQLD